LRHFSAVNELEQLRCTWLFDDLPRCDLGILHCQEVERFAEAGQGLDALSPSDDVYPCCEILVAEPRERDVSITANISNCRHVADEKVMTREMSVKDA
jgi:hypothetical protein